MQLQFTITNTEQIAAALVEKSNRLENALIEKVNVLDTMLQSKVQDKLQGQVLNFREGNLFRAVKVDPAKSDGKTISGSVYVDPNEVTAKGTRVIDYALVHEKGGKGPYVIMPVNAKVLAFQVNGVSVFARKVIHPALPARPFMEPTLFENEPTIGVEITKTVVDTIKEP